jgi:hypothetical protein
MGFEALQIFVRYTLIFAGVGALRYNAPDETDFQYGSGESSN